jgi:hypothetical protein
MLGIGETFTYNREHNDIHTKQVIIVTFSGSMHLREETKPLLEMNNEYLYIFIRPLGTNN